MNDKLEWILENIVGLLIIEAFIFVNIGIIILILCEFGGI